MAEWSGKDPTEPGAYWWWCDGMMEIVEIDYNRDAKGPPSGPLYQYETGLDHAVRVRDKAGMWWGPIERPQDPPDD